MVVGNMSFCAVLVILAAITRSSVTQPTADRSPPMLPLMHPPYAISDDQFSPAVQPYQPDYGPVSPPDETGNMLLRQLHKEVKRRIENQASLVAVIVRFYDDTLASTNKISSLAAAWCRG